MTSAVGEAPVLALDTGMTELARFGLGPAAVELVRGNIVDQEVEAIVNAANSALAGGGGVDGAIHRAPGWDRLQEALRAIGGCPTGSAVITDGFALPARRIIHAVGPVYHGGDQGEAELLRSAYDACLKIAARESLESIAFPSLSTGAYGYPFREAAPIALACVRDHLAGPTSLRLVRFVLFDPGSYAAFSAAAREIFARSV